MKFKRIDCPSCGAPLTVGENTAHVTCNFCGTSLTVDFSGSDLTLKFAKEVENGIQDVGKKIKASFRESSDSTKLELKRIQIQQQLVSLENRLVRLNDEIRYLERVKTNRKQRRQLASLKNDKHKISQRISSIEKELYGIATTGGSPKTTAYVHHEDKKTRWRASCLSGCLVYFVMMVIIIGIGTAIVGSAAAENDILIGIGGTIALLAGTIAFFYKLKPESKMSLWFREKIRSVFKKKTKTK